MSSLRVEGVPPRYLEDHQEPLPLLSLRPAAGAERRSRQSGSLTSKSVRAEARSRRTEQHSRFCRRFQPWQDLFLNPRSFAVCSRYVRLVLRTVWRPWFGHAEMALLNGVEGSMTDLAKRKSASSRPPRQTRNGVAIAWCFPGSLN